MFKEFNRTNPASWGNLATLPEEEFNRILSFNDTKKQLKEKIKFKRYKVTPMKVYKLTQYGESFIISAKDYNAASFQANYSGVKSEFPELDLSDSSTYTMDGRVPTTTYKIEDIK